jgi:hypothetical protein
MAPTAFIIVRWQRLKISSTFVSREQKSMLKIVLAAGVLVSLSTSGAFAQSAAAKNVLNSCKPDIARFCSAVLPGDGRIKGCMKQHLPELSEGCKEALFQAWLRQ